MRCRAASAPFNEKEEPDKMRIPFVDLKAQYATIKGEIDETINAVVESTQFIGGERLATFEKNFADYTEARYGVGCSSGTSAIHLALCALGIGKGDEVITACNTFIATTEGITHSGAKTVFVDVIDDTQNIDPERIEAAITPRTRAIIPVHLYGQPALMDPIRDIASRHGLKIIADAAQSHGAEYKGSRRETLGDITTYSFYPGKNLGAYGDAGMVMTDDSELADRMRLLANHGRYDKYSHIEEGYNYRLDTLQAAILDVKLRHLDRWTEKRRSHAVRYAEAFTDESIRPVQENPHCKSVYHLYVVRLTDRDRAMEALGSRSIATGVHYPVPLHLQKAYEYLGYSEGAFPNAEKATREILSLPMFAELTNEMVDEVITALKEAVG
ncbi:MAG: DegT/DnrJ/EryC1/StrS family aminotransferase [bacterium]|nr:DegT/DnrJ/EryC1/StrS family aminotransferase [bacterium]